MRTGSTWLCSLLDNHPDIDCRQELLHKKTYRGKPSGAKEYLDKCLFETSDRPIRGFKILYHQMRGSKSPSCQIFAYLFQHILKCKIIHIQRRSELEAYVSHQLAMRSGLWNVFLKDQKINFKTLHGKKFDSLEQCIEDYNQPFSIDIDDLKLFYKKQEEWRNNVREWFPGHIEVFYEDLPDLGEVYNYLGVSPVAAAKQETVKLRQLPLEHLVLNLKTVQGLA